MLKVSLLPESYKKQIVGSKKKDAIKRVALIVLVMVLAMLVVVVGTRQLVYSKLHEVEALNQKTVDMFPQLNEYEALYAEVVVQRELLDSISAKEPYAQNFVVSLGNIVMPNVWLNKVLAEDWFYTKQCTIEGKCLSYDELSAYIDKISGIEDVLSVTINTFEVTTETTGAGESIYNFSLIISVDGLGEVYVIPTLVEEVSTTLLDETGG